MITGNEAAYANPGNTLVDAIYSIGLTKREYFAALAMQGLCANKNAPSPKTCAEVAVFYADALIEELNKE